MRFSIIALALAAAVAAYPKADPQFEEIGPAPSKLPVSVPSRPTPTRRRKHKEPTPTFKKSICECARPIIPVNQFTAQELPSPRACRTPGVYDNPNLTDSYLKKCEFEYAHSMACYFRTQGGCPLPTLSCGK